MTPKKNIHTPKNMNPAYVCMNISEYPYPSYTQTLLQWFIWVAYSLFVKVPNSVLVFSWGGGYLRVIIPPANFVCGGVYCIHVVRACVCASVRASVRPSVRPSVTFYFFNILKSHCWIFIKPCKHVHISKTKTLDKIVRARGQFY